MGMRQCSISLEGLGYTGEFIFQKLFNGVLKIVAFL